MSDFLFLDPGSDVTRRDVYRRGRDLGMRVVLVSGRLGWERDEIDEWIQANPANPAEVLAALERRPAPVGVVNCSESCLETAAAVAGRYGLPGLPSEVVRLCRDKVLMGERLVPHGVPMAKRFVLVGPQDAEAAVAAVGLPGVLKPSTGVASRFTVRFDTVEELADRVRVFNARLDQGRPEFLRHMRGRWVVEEFLDGQAFSVESLVAGGVVSHVAVCEKGAIQGPYFREIGHSSPPRVADRVARELRRLAEQVIHLIGIDDCVTHAEFKVVGEQPVLLEIGARMGGGSIRQVVRNATGVDLLDLTLQLAMGRTPVATPVDGGAAASRSLYPASAGTVASVDTGPIAAQPGIVDVNLWLAKGDTYRLPPDGYGEVLGVVAAAETADEAIRLAQHAIEVARERTVLV